MNNTDEERIDQATASVLGRITYVMATFPLKLRNTLPDGQLFWTV